MQGAIRPETLDVKHSRDLYGKKMMQFDAPMRCFDELDRAYVG